MLRNNDIDIFLTSEELLNIFHELIPQIVNDISGVNIKFNITSEVNKKNHNSIMIIDLASLIKLISEKFIFNSYIFIVGAIEERLKTYLDKTYVNYEFIDSPISYLSLINKCKSLNKQINNSISEIVKFKKFSYSFQLNTIYTYDSSLYLTDKENEIFQSLIESNKNSLNKKQLLSKVWSYDDDIDTHTLETHIYTLRKKIKKKLNLSNLIKHNENGYLINE